MIFADIKHLFYSHRRIFFWKQERKPISIFPFHQKKKEYKILFKRNTHCAFVLKHHRAHCRKSKFALLLSKKWAIRCLHEKMDTLNQHAHISKRSLFIEFNFLLQKTEKNTRTYFAEAAQKLFKADIILLHFWKKSFLNECLSNIRQSLPF